MPGGEETLQRQHLGLSISSLLSVPSCSQLKQTTEFTSSQVCYSLWHSTTGPSELNIHYELFIPLLLFFFSFLFSFYKATWDTFASGLEVEMTPCTQWLLSCDFKDTRKHNKRGHVWVHWRNHSLGWLGMGIRMGEATLHSQWSLFV